MSLCACGGFGDALLVVLVVSDVAASILVPADLDALKDVVHFLMDAKTRGPIVVS